jgi:hypothetical protein
MEPSAYERRALDGIRAWKEGKQTRLGHARRVLALPFEKVGGLLFKVPGVAWVVDKSVGQLVHALNQFAQSSVRHAAIHGEYRGDGHAHVSHHSDMVSLDLEQIDRTIGRLAAKYKALALAEGAATGFVGLAGIPVDVVALVTLNLRAVGEYATYCGFDVREQEERLFALHVLGYVSGPTPREKQQALAQLLRIAREASTKKPWKEMKKHAFVRIVKQIAKALGIRLTKAKLAQIVPAAGSIVGGLFNAQFTSSVCTAASMLYRERFLAEKYGDALLIGQISPLATSSELGRLPRF